VHFDAATIERTIAVIGAVIVGVTSVIALKNDWKTPGIENHVFKLMLALLAFGAVLAFFAGLGVLGNFPGKAA
jgi:F0F1-type ATP synthase membrane subunit c/vacuolar-type H+-ATPase subunit K